MRGRRLVGLCGHLVNAGALVLKLLLEAIDLTLRRNICCCWAAKASSSACTASSTNAICASSAATSAIVSPLKQIRYGC